MGESKGPKGVFLLINCAMGQEEYVAKSLSEMKGVAYADGVYGVYDVVAKFEGPEENIRYFVDNKVRSDRRVSSLLELVYYND